jgi:hypothetical protein
MLAREKPHCGISGVPFMNRTIGAVATALSMADRTSLESNRVVCWWSEVKREERKGLARGRRAWFVACEC